MFRVLWGASRRLVVKEVIKIHKIQIAMLQESKLKCTSDRQVKEIWGGRNIKQVVVDAIRAADRLLLMWDTRSISMLNS